MEIETIGTIINNKNGVTTIKYSDEVDPAHKLADALNVVAMWGLTVHYTDKHLSVTVDESTNVRIFGALDEALNNPEICAIGPCP